MKKNNIYNQIYEKLNNDDKGEDKPKKEAKIQEEPEEVKKCLCLDDC